MKRAISILLLVAIFVGMGDFGRLNVARAQGVPDWSSVLIDGSWMRVAHSSIHNYSIVLTVGTAGIAANADSPRFVIPTDFTTPHANGGAIVPTNAGEVDVSGEWFAEAAGNTCAVAMGTSSASGQEVSVDVTSDCVENDTITLTYRGAAGRSGFIDFNIYTDDVSGGNSAMLIADFGQIDVAGGGTATISDLDEAAGASVTNEKFVDDKIVVALTVGPNGIASNADSPIFRIFSNYFAPTNPVANAGLVASQGDWSVAASGGTCSVDMNTSVAVGYEITVDVVGDCVDGDLITLTTITTSPYPSMGVEPAANISTDDYSGGGTISEIMVQPNMNWVDTTPPAVSTVTWQDVDTSGDMSGGDTITVTFNDQMSVEWWMSLNDGWVDAYLGLNNGHTFDTIGAGILPSWNLSNPQGNYMIRQLTVTIGPSATVAFNDTIDPSTTATDTSANPDATPSPVPILMGPPPLVVPASSATIDPLGLLKTTLAQPIYGIDKNTPSYTNVTYAWKQPKAFSVANGDACISANDCVWIVLMLGQTSGQQGPGAAGQEWMNTLSVNDISWNGPPNSSPFAVQRTDQNLDGKYETLSVAINCSSACTFATSTEYSMTIVNLPIKNPSAPVNYVSGTYTSLLHTFTILDNSISHQNDASLISRVVVGVGLTVLANVDPSLSFSVAGYSTPSSFYSDSVSVDNSASPDTCSFGILSPAVPKVCAWYLNIATNASNGYSIYVVQDQDMTFNGNTIKQFKDGTRIDDAAATAWTVPDSLQLAHLGYSSNDTDIFPPTGGTTAVWAGIPTIAGVNEAPVITGLVASNALPESHQYTYAIKIESAATLPQGTEYMHHEYFMVVGNF